MNDDRLTQNIGPKVTLDFELLPSLIAKYIDYLKACHQRGRSTFSANRPQAPKVPIAIGQRSYEATVADARFDSNGICRSLCLKVAANLRPDNRELFIIASQDDYLSPPRWGMVYIVDDVVSQERYNARMMRYPFPQLQRRGR